MYKFSRLKAGVFAVYVAHTSAGDTHLKRFVSSATTRNQDTANLYTEGEYRLSSGNGLSAVFGAGSCSFDQDLSFAAGEVVTETSITAGTRFCVSAATAWSRRVEETDFLARDGEILIPLSGSITVGQKTISAGNVAVVQDGKMVAVSGRVFIATPEISP